MQFTVNVFQLKQGANITWTTVGLGALTVTKRGVYAGKVQQALLDELRTRVAALDPRELEQVELVRGARLETVKMELTLRDEGRKRKVSMQCPLVVEPRWASDDRRFVIAYHPFAQDLWLPVREELPLAEQAAAYFAQAWSACSDEELESYRVNGRWALKAVAFSVETKSLLDKLPKRPAGPWDDLVRDDARDQRRGRGGTKVLAAIGSDLTQRAIDGDLPVPPPRARYREQLRTLLTGSERQPCALVGPPGAGRTTLVEQCVHDLLAADDYAAHRNADRVRHVWRVAGRRIIAGMSHLGEWEQRCLDLLDDLRRRPAVLAVDDLHHFGRIGRSRDSDRSLAEFFRGPLQRREIAMIGDCTAEQWQRLEDDAPAFAALFTRVPVAAADEAETLRTLVQARPALELEHRVAIDAGALRAVQQLGAAMIPNRADPGRSIDLLRLLARTHAAPAVEGRSAVAEVESGNVRTVGEGEVIELLSLRTGLPIELLAPTSALAPSEIAESLGRGVMGQPEAVDAAVDLVCRVREGLVDPKRPWAVYLFTGPTGTGKTELARTLAEYLYSDASRLLRFDMAEYGTADAAARLVGDRWNPDGALTRAVTQQPFCVVLFDEVEKAHPAVHNLLLQLFDDGRLTDATGATASFAHAVIVMTSNLGARSQPPAGFGASALADAGDQLRAVREFFSPELFNRIDRVVPFRPLTPEVARAVAAKELAKLTARRGLTDRNVFVSAAPDVLDLLVAQAFRSEDGARSLKRAIEDLAGSALTEHLAGGERAELQLVRVHAVGERVALDVESLVEADACGDDFPLLDLADAPASALRAHLDEARAAVEAVLASPELRALGESVGERLDAIRARGADGDPGDAVYTLDAIRGDITRLREELDELARAASSEEDWDLRALELFSRESRTDHSDGTHPRSVQVFARRAVAGARPPLRDTLLRALSRAYAAPRLVALARDFTQHAALIHIERATGTDARRPGEHSLFDALRELFTAVGDVVGVAARSGDGDAAALDDPRYASPAVVAITLRVAGLGVRDALALERGTHIWIPRSRPPEVVRVEVEAAPGGSTVAALQARIDASRARDDARRRGERVAAAALPVVRTIRWEPPARRGAAAPWSVEDFALGHARETTARSIAEPLRDLWLLRAARVTRG